MASMPSVKITVMQRHDDEHDDQGHDHDHAPILPGQTAGDPREAVRSWW